jgi:hypothetical protein
MSEKNENNFDFNEFIAESIHSLRDPKGYFSTFSVTGGYTEPVIKALIYSVIAAVINYIWFIAGLNVAGFGFWGAASGPMVLVGGAIGGVIGLFIGGVIMLIISAICSGNTDYEANVRVVASLMVLTPINAALGFLFIISSGLAALVSLAVSAYGLWMTYNALVLSLQAKESTAKVLVIILLVIVALGTFAGMATSNAITEFSNY